MRFIRLFFMTILLSVAICAQAATTGAKLPQDEMPSKAAIQQAIQWRKLLLKQGGAGLFQSINMTALRHTAGLQDDEPDWLKQVKKLLAGTRPARARVYWAPRYLQTAKEKQQHIVHHWVARLDYKKQHLNFLVLKTGKQGRLAGWEDMGLGVSLAQLITAANSLANKNSQTLRQFFHQLNSKPLQALDEIPADNPLSRLVLAACLSKGCYTKALQQIPLRQGEVSLFALEKMTQAKNTKEANRIINALKLTLAGDPAFAWLQTTLLMTEKDCQQALAVIYPAIKRWPGEARLYPLASQCEVSRGKPEKAFATLKAMERQTGISINWKALVKKPVYAPLKGYIDK